MLNDGIDAEITERFGEQAEIIKLKLRLTANKKVNVLLECFLNKPIIFCPFNTSAEKIF
ncbi:hypothetical protein [Nostoc sp. DedQUE12b]|uniref:hypothetical protein n=1 Tax=Nostoc sp. DedQUE12b TaxID=3075398 RepID=UPI002AD599B1|nr:hypothetical protein [Nostoc sp. DedQUE12b]